jgi:2-methylcitrate dehydratase PrpD
MTIWVSQFGARTTDNRDMPDICMQHLCAVMLLDGTVSFKSSHDERRMRDPKVLALRRRIELIGDEALEKLLPQRHGIVELELKDGRRLRYHTPAVRGAAENPMTRPEVDKKCYDLLAPVLGRSRSRALCDAVWNIERLKDARRLGALLRA